MDWSRLRNGSGHVLVIRVAEICQLLLLFVYSYCIHSSYSMTEPNNPSASGRAGSMVELPLTTLCPH